MDDIIKQLTTFENVQTALLRRVAELENRLSAPDVEISRLSKRCDDLTEWTTNLAERFARLENGQTYPVAEASAQSYDAGYQRGRADAFNEAAAMLKGIDK